MCIFVPLAIAFIIGVYKYLRKPWLVFFILMPVTGISTAIATSSRGAIVGLSGVGTGLILRRPNAGVVVLAGTA